MPETTDDYLKVDDLIRVVTRVVSGDTGASATLRRLDPEDEVGVPLLHSVLAQAGVRAVGRDVLERYATCVRIAAIMARMPGKGMPLGRALAEMGYSETRLARFGNAADRTLSDSATSIAKLAESKGVKIAVHGLCAVVLAKGHAGGRAEKELRRIMAGYYARTDVQAPAS